MFKFFRRSKADRSEKNPEKNAKKKKNSKQNDEKLSTLENSFGVNACAAATSTSSKRGDINKALVVEDLQVDRKISHSENSTRVFVDDRINDGNVDRRNTKEEKSSRNEIVDRTGNDRKWQCRRNQNDRSQSDLIDNAANQTQQQLHNQAQHPSKQEQQQSTSLFKPINKSREFFYEIMGKNRNRNRNKNLNDKKCAELDTSSIIISDCNADQQNISNEKTQRKCGKTAENRRDTAASDASNEKLDKSVENRKVIRNFGYQITKSKNRKNLVMKYEGEDDVDEKCEKDCAENGGCGIVGDRNNPTTIAEDQRGIDCADASSDVELCENRYFEGNHNRNNNNNGSNSTNAEVIVIGDLNLHGERPTSGENDLCSDHENQQSQKRTAALKAHEDRDDSKEWHSLVDKIVNRSSEINDFEKISELTECDRDQHQQQQSVSIETSNMGQENSKGSACNRQSNRSANQSSDHVQNIVIPTITVADYSDHQKAQKETAASNHTATDNDIFYDTETFDNDHLSVHQNVDSTTDDWHFVTCESDQVIIEDDPDNICDDYDVAYDIPTTVIDPTKIARDDSNIFRSSSDSATSVNFSNNSSSSNLIDSKHHTDSPDSGIELLDDSHRNLSSDRLLNIDRDSELFVRGNSTDCDENFLIHSDSSDRYDRDDRDNRSKYHQHKKDKAIVIDSISLPDVVVESTSSMGNSNSIKTVEHIIEDRKNSTIILTDHNDNDTRDLVNQEARYSAQLEEAQKIIFSTQTKVNELQSKIDSLEKELSIKSWNVDRLQAELQAAHKEDDCVRRRLKLLQEEIVNLKQKFSESEYDLNRRYDDLETQHTELKEKYQQTQSLARTLQTQLAFAQSDTEQCRLEKQKLCEEKDTELKNLQDALAKSQDDRKQLEEKWQKEFELLRTQNADQEEHLLADCEWQLRTMQKTCKEKVEAAVKSKNEALEKATEISNRASEQLEQVSHLLPLEAEVKQLRGLTNDQRESLNSMTEQLDDLRSELEAANQELENEINNVQKIRMQCDNALSDKERQMLQKIEEARGIVAEQWETRLLEEMTRLKNELESVHVDERRDALDKLEIEHIEEIKVLTCRYDTNEEELRSEMAILSKKLQDKTDILNVLQTKTDATLLQTRMHLERADTEYQCAMNREIEKRDMLAEQLKAEFDKEKLEMEEKFRERLGHVKEEFAKELSNTTEEMASKHRMQLEQQWAKLVSEKEEALETMENRHRIRLEEADNRIKDIEIQHHRDLKEIKINYEIERTTLESRDLQNSQEIEQLHRKCRCLTNLFEEMRMRYERRDPRPEDLREIGELRERCESQERDLHVLTERLREIQIERENEAATGKNSRKGKVARKPPPKAIPTNCDVIYEENEERESPPKDSNGNTEKIDSDESDTEEEDADEISEFSEISEIIAVES